MKMENTLVPAGGYLARDVRGRDLGRAAAYTVAILRAEKAGPGSVVVATDAEGVPLTRADGTEFVAYTAS